jgi:hypothetical protein
VLFDFLSYCLTGEIEKAMLKRPTKIKLLYITDTAGGPNFAAASPGFIGLLSQPTTESTGTGCSVTYSFLIHRDQLEDITSSSTLGLGLYPGNTSNTDSEIYNVVAFCKLGDLSTTNILASSSLVVDWKLTISNR